MTSVCVINMVTQATDVSLSLMRTLAQAAVNVAFAVSILDLNRASVAGDALDAAVTGGELLAELVRQGLVSLTGVTMVVAPSIRASPPSPSPPPWQVLYRFLQTAVATGTF